MIVGVYVDDLLVGESGEDCESLLVSQRNEKSGHYLRAGFGSEH